MNNIDEVLAERGANYGKFAHRARIVQDMKHILHTSPSWPSMTDSQKEALEMIVNNIGRICNGNPCYKDSWDNIVGYAQLESRILSKCDI